MHHRHVNVAFAFVLLRTERQHTHTRTSLRPIDSKSFETNLFVLTSESINRRVTRATELVLRNTQRVHIDRTTQAFDAHRPSDKSISFISTDIHFDFVKQLQYAVRTDRPFQNKCLLENSLLLLFDRKNTRFFVLPLPTKSKQSHKSQSGDPDVMAANTTTSVFNEINL